VEVTDSDTHYSLIRDGINFGREEFDSATTGGLHYKKHYGFIMYGLRSKLVCLFVQGRRTIAYYKICHFPINYGLYCFIQQVPDLKGHLVVPWMKRERERERLIQLLPKYIRGLDSDFGFSFVHLSIYDMNETEQNFTTKSLRKKKKKIGKFCVFPIRETAPPRSNFKCFRH
jgi:hypothetical protein